MYRALAVTPTVTLGALTVGCAILVVWLAVLFVLVLFDMFLEEGICGRFGRFGAGRFAYRPARGLFSDDAGVSFTVFFRAVFGWPGGRQGLSPDVVRGRCAKVRRQGYPVCDMGFQLESLILAQNERWRQA